MPVNPDRPNPPFVNACRQFAAVAAVALVAASIHRPGAAVGSPALLLSALPGLAALIAASVLLAWRLPPPVNRP